MSESSNLYADRGSDGMGEGDISYRSDFIGHTVGCQPYNLKSYLATKPLGLQGYATTPGCGQTECTPAFAW